MMQMQSIRAGLIAFALLAAGLGPVPGAAVAQTPTATSERGARVLIVDGSAVLRQTPADLQALLGQPVRSRRVPPGDFRLPGGGMSRVYRGQGTRIDVDFEQERSTTVMIEFPDRAIAPRTYEEALEAVNLPYDPLPDFATHDSQEWHDLQGYFVRVIAASPALERIDTIILSVHPLP